MVSPASLLLSLAAIGFVTWRETRPGGFFDAVPALGEPGAETSPTLERSLRYALATIAAAFVLSPLVLADGSDWPAGGHPLAGFLLTSSLVLTYARLTGRVLFFRRHPDGHRLGRTDLAVLLALPLYTLFVGNGRLLTSGDNRVTRMLGAHLVTERTLDLPESRGPLHYSALRVGDRTLPSFPLGTGLLSVPYAAIALTASGGQVTDALLDRWEKHLAALLATASALLLFLALRGRFREGPALAATLLYATATTTFTTTSQALFSTTGEVFFLCAALALLVPPQRTGPVSAGLAGLALGAAFLCRPTALVAGGLLVLSTLARDRRRGVASGLALALATVVGCSLQMALYGHPLGGYGLMNGHGRQWSASFGEGLLGTLLSPSRGLLVHLPYLLLLALPAVVSDVRRDRELRILWSVSLLGTLGTVLLASLYVKWWGGHSLGPRLMTEAAPFLAILTLPLWRRFPGLGAARLAVAGTVAFAATTQLLQAYSPRALVWNEVMSIDQRPEALWSIRDSQLAATFLPGWTPGARPPRPAPQLGPLYRVDLRRAANARYDLDPFWSEAPEGATPHYPRLDPDALSRTDSLFRFSPTGRPNAVTTCRGARPLPIAVPALETRRLHLVLAAGATRPAPEHPLLATLRVRYQDGASESFPLRQDLEVFEYHVSRRGADVPTDRVYWGDARDADVLVRTVLVPVSPDRVVVSVELVPEEGVAPAGVSLLALTIESPRRGAA